jgi:FixJ family two-component response regulator
MGLTVAVVDDEPAVRKALGRLLRTVGYEPRQFAGAEEFLRALGHERFACVILDLQMPGMSGLELQAWPAFRQAGVPAIVISARDDGATRAACLAAGALAYLPKPVDDAELLAAIRKADDSVVHPS